MNSLYEAAGALTFSRQHQQMLGKRKSTTDAPQISQMMECVFTGPAYTSITSAIASKLKSQDQKEKLQALALLASTDTPLETILSTDRSLISNLYALIKMDDEELVAETMQVFRSWMSSGNEETIRLLYAHCLFPEVLEQLARTAAKLNSWSTNAPNEQQVRLVENWINSLMIIIWVIVEEVPASLGQLNNKSSLGFLTTLVFEKNSLFKSDTIILMLRCLLCAREDNAELFSDIDTVRMCSLLERLESSDMPHVQMLAFALNKLMSGQEVTDLDITRLGGFIEKAVAEDGEDFLCDTLETMANYLSELSCYDGSAGLLIGLSGLLGKLPLEKNEKSLSRVLSCILNLIPFVDILALRTTVDTIWKIICSVIIMDHSHMEMVLNFAAKLMRAIVLAYHQANIQLVCDEHLEKRIMDICENHVKDDELLSALASIPAIIKSNINVKWSIDFVKEQLFKVGRSIGVLVAASEIVERLFSMGRVTFELSSYLCANQERAIKAAANVDCQEEIEYIRAIIKSCSPK